MTHVTGMTCQCSTKLPVMPHTDLLGFLSPQMPTKMLSEVEATGDCGGKSLTVRTPWALSLKVVWIPPQIHKDQTRRWRMSLENGVVSSLLSQGGGDAMQKSNSRRGNTPPDLNFATVMFHCGFETLWYHSISYSLGFIESNSVSVTELLICISGGN